ncbi:TetR/AcrR family transcriptional regulator [Nocardia gipuzkoensis]
MATVVVRDGLASVTLSRMAGAAGIQRGLVLHYFGSGAGLMQAFVTEVIAAYGTSVAHHGADRPLLQRVDAMFEPGICRNREDLVVWSELVALSARDATVRARLQHLWMQRWLPDIEQPLADEYPAASAARIAAAAYALACRFEARWSFGFHVDIQADRQRRVQTAGCAILTTLGSGARHAL